MQCLTFHLEKFWAHYWDLQWQKPDDWGMIQSPTVWFHWSGWLSCGNRTHAHIVSHLPISRNHYRELAEAQWKSRALPVLPLPSGPRPHLKLSGQPLHGMLPAALLGSQLKIAHQFIIVACQQHLCCIGTPLNFRICFRVTQRDYLQLNSCHYLIPCSIDIK